MNSYDECDCRRSIAGDQGDVEDGKGARRSQRRGWREGVSSTSEWIGAEEVAPTSRHDLVIQRRLGVG